MEATQDAQPDTGPSELPQVERRPHCMKCGSASVFQDVDRIDSRNSIYCAICGNRQYQGMDYVGFEMREVSTMSKKGTCKNCERPDMCLIQEGMCGMCAQVQRNYRNDPARLADELKAVKERISRGDIRKVSAPGKRAERPDPAAKTEKPSPAPREKKAGSRNDDPFIVIQFSGADVKLLDEFREYARKKRRLIQDQLLYMIENAVMSDKADRKELIS